MSRHASVCVLVSGGLDSDALLADLAHRYGLVHPVYVRQGLVWEKAEQYWLRRFIRAMRQPSIQPLQVLSLPMHDLYGTHWSLGRRHAPGYRSNDKAVYLPGRNLVLTVKAAVYCAMQKVRLLAIGSLGHNPFPDASPSFFVTWSKALSKGLKTPIRIMAPYRSLSKAEVIRRYQTYPLDLSFSCLAPQGRRHCGHCNKCAERQRAFRLAGVKDKTSYANKER